ASYYSCVFLVFLFIFFSVFFFFFQAEDGIRYRTVTGVQTCALPISSACPCWPTYVPSRSVSSASTGTRTPTGPTEPTGAPRCSRSEERRVGKGGGCRGSGGV